MSRWPYSVYVDGDSLDEVRAGFREAARFAFDRPGEVDLREHVEEEVDDGLWVRVALDGLRAA